MVSFHSIIRITFRDYIYKIEIGNISKVIDIVQYIFRVRWNCSEYAARVNNVNDTSSEEKYRQTPNKVDR